MDFDSWHSYPSIFALGHKHLAELLLDPVLVEEKIDGSQFSFGVFAPGDNGWGGLRCRSKGVQLNIFAPDKMFENAVNVAKDLAAALRPGWTYRAEYLLKPKHNALAYERMPARHLIIFDINTGHEEYLPYDAKAEEAVRLGLEVVPRIHEGAIEDVQHFRAMLETISCLGGQRIEGVVVKNYRRFGLDKKCLMGKFVSEAFKEVHAAEWKKSNPSSGDIVDNLIAQYRNPTRWAKAVQHLREAGKLEGSPRDIGGLFKEVPADILKECEDDIKAALLRWAWPKVQRGVTAGLAEWYKERLLEQQFANEGWQPPQTGGIES